MTYKNSKISTIIPARNEECFIGETLSALLKQEILPDRIIVVNDGSEDNTNKIAATFQEVEVINIENRGFNAQGTPILANVINIGLKKLRNDNSEYVMILGADHILPKNYISVILEQMDKNKEIAICSGQIRGENSTFPRGSGRIVQVDFWNKIGLQYPLNYGFETYLLIKAQQLGYKIQILNNLKSDTSRPTRKSYNRETYISYGKSLKVLGYSPLYSMGRISLISLNNPRGAYYMIKGYRSKDICLYEDDIRQFYKNLQYKTFLNLLRTRIKQKCYNCSSSNSNNNSSNNNNNN
jgi:glycosyltransferase involved in cell wall biosynthesis